MRRFAPLCIVLLLVGCGADAPSRRPEPAVADVRFDELGGEVWSFSRRVSGQAPEGCVTIEIKRGPVHLRVPVERRRFSAVVPLAPGENVVGAFCADPDVPARDARAVYRVRLPATPRALVRVSERDDGLALDAGASAPNEGTDLPIASYRWSEDVSNPAPLATLDGRALESLSGAHAAIATPEVDGEYVVWLTVTDAAGREDRAGTYFVVERGRARRVDRAREHPDWVDDAVVYGVVPSLYGDPAFDAVIEHLPRLAELGVTTLWLSPIFESPEDDFGYAVTDYFHVRSDWGSMERFRALVDRAHELGMRVILDFVPNHTSAEHRYFVHASRYGRRSPYWSFYDRDASGRPTHYFDWENLPNLDYDNPEVRRWMTEAFSFWARELDVDGFRVDVAWGVADRAPGFFGGLRDELARIEPKVALVAEASARRATYFDDGFDAAYDWTGQVGQWAWADVFDEGAADVSALNDALTVAPRDDLVFRFLDNNDTGARFATRHGADLERVAAALLFTVPGIPSLFTGQEVGASYQPYERERPLEFRSDPERFDYYRSLIELRRREEALSRGSFVPLSVANAEDRVYAYARIPRGEGRPVVVVLDFAGEPADARVRLTPEVAALLRGRRAERLLGSAGAARRGETELRVRLAPFDTAVWAFDN